MSRRATGDEGGYFYLGKPFAPLYQSTNIGLKNMNIMRKVMIWNMLIVSVIFFRQQKFFLLPSHKGFPFYGVTLTYADSSYF